MTTVVVPADPPIEGVVFSQVADASILSPAEATQLYTACLQDVCRAVSLSGGDLLVNYRPSEQLSKTGAGEVDSKAQLETALDAAVDVGLDDVRFEVQVGSTPSARRGNTITHLLDEEGTGSVAVVEPDAPLVDRPIVDQVAMSLRRSAIVLAPGGHGSVAIAGFTETIDFTDAFTDPAMRSVTDRALDAGLEVDFAARSPRVQSVDDLVTVLVEIQSRDRANRVVPPHTAATIESLGLDTTREHGDLVLVRT